MSKIKGAVAIAGLATLLMVLVACSNGEASKSPTETQPTDPSTSQVAPLPPQGPQGSTAAGPREGGPMPPVRAPAIAAAGAPYSSLLQTGNSQVGIWVTGQGTISLEPDLVLLNIGVETVDDTVAQARGEAATAMDAVVTALGEQGVESRDIQTRFFDISPQYEFQEVIELGRRSGKQVLVGYRVSNTAVVKIRQLDKVGEIIDEVASAGGDAIRVNGIRFTVEDPEPFMSDLRENAVRDALAKAQQFASLTGVSVGQLVYITETGGAAPVVRDFEERTFAVAAAAPSPTSIGGGQLELRMNVQMVFDIQ